MVGGGEGEGGLRAILNYGHTVGHAIEAATGYTSVLHGEAISIGMMAGAEIGERAGVTLPAIAARQRTLFEKYALPMRIEGIDVDAVMAATMHDKKVASKKVRWVLLEDFGRPVVRDDIPEALVRAVLHDMLD